MTQINAGIALIFNISINVIPCIVHMQSFTLKSYDTSFVNSFSSPKYMFYHSHTLMKSKTNVENISCLSP